MSDALLPFFGPPITGVLFPCAALIPTIIVETLVASLFRAASLFEVGARGIAAVALVNLVTNPLLNVALALVYGLGLGIWQTGVFVRSMGRTELTTHTEWFFYAAFVALEVVAVFVEWGLLRWALRREAPHAGRLLVMSACMNAASASMGLVFSLPLLKL